MEATCYTTQWLQPLSTYLNLAFILLVPPHRRAHLKLINEPLDAVHFFDSLCTGIHMLSLKTCSESVSHTVQRGWDMQESLPWATAVSGLSSPPWEGAAAVYPCFNVQKMTPPEDFQNCRDAWPAWQSSTSGLCLQSLWLSCSPGCGGQLAAFLPVLCKRSFWGKVVPEQGTSEKLRVGLISKVTVTGLYPLIPVALRPFLYGDLSIFGSGIKSPQVRLPWLRFSKVRPSGSGVALAADVV